ncbi:MAG: GNAT family N-acetyltransferase [Acidimicrobiia bacterium]
MSAADVSRVHQGLVIVDGLATGRRSEVRRQLSDYVAATRVELNWLPPDGPEQLPEALVRELEDPARVYPAPGSVFLAFQGAVAIGCVGLRPVDELTGEIRRLFVQPQHRLGGAAGALMDAAHQRAMATGMTRLVLTVAPAREVALSWYKRLGYIESGTQAAESMSLVSLVRVIAGVEGSDPGSPEPG